MAGASLTVQNSPASRQIRVFLSSTFRDFMEERDLLVKQVFPELRRKARERGVEVVDVDLRWGVTQEESEQGKVIGICLAEIDRCRPYFIGMLGERYGWTPGKTDYPDELFEREQLGWIRDHQGNASVTELEILHGVLNDKEMAGRAFFYFRDPAWSREQSEPGFVCDTAEEEAKLAALKDRIRASGFPVAEDLPNPKAIADQIEAVLWALIEEQYPDLNQPDALEKEARKHASYRQARLGVYLGQEYVDQLNALVHGGAKKILITGKSGSGKSALIANWMHQHEREHPGDVVYAHHLGCSNDANAIRPLLSRLLDTASRLLLEHDLIFEPIQVPQDWWELTATVAKTLQDVGRWCKATGHRWIWVLDGLDRLADDDQQALPWLPLLIPEGVSVVISALECPARTTLVERQFQSLTIDPLQRPEQEALIERYLERYTKKLEPERRQQILNCELATSPLFLRVLLEELRQCGRFETLKDQIEGYIRPNADGSMEVSDLYERVLERLEADFGVELVGKVMTALWASRAGLSESELLVITGLAPLQWAPINAALDEALGKNGNKLIFDHDFLRAAVRIRYLRNSRLAQAAHSTLANWLINDSEAARRYEELAWQLSMAARPHDLTSYLTSIEFIESTGHPGGIEKALQYWQMLDGDQPSCIESLYKKTWLDVKILPNRSKALVLSLTISEILLHAGQHGKFAKSIALDCLNTIKAVESTEEVAQRAKILVIELLRLRGEYAEALTHAESLLIDDHLPVDGHKYSHFLLVYADLCICLNYFDKAFYAYKQAIKKARGPDKELCRISLAWLDYSLGRYSLAETELHNALARLRTQLGSLHNYTTQAENNLALVIFNQGRLPEALTLAFNSWEKTKENIGAVHWVSMLGGLNYGWILQAMGDLDGAMSIYYRALENFEQVFGSTHPLLELARYSIGWAYVSTRKYGNAKIFLSEALHNLEAVHGPRHPDLACVHELLAWLYLFSRNLNQASAHAIASVSIIKSSYGLNHPSLILPMAADGILLLYKHSSDASEERLLECDNLAKQVGFSDSLDRAQVLTCLGYLYHKTKRLNAAKVVLGEAHSIRSSILGADHNDVSTSRANIRACDSVVGRSQVDIRFSAHRFTGSSTM